MLTQFFSELNDCCFVAGKLCAAGIKFPAFESCILYGNEDAPIAVDLYVARDPLLSDAFVRIAFDCFPLE